MRRALVAVIAAVCCHSLLPAQPKPKELPRPRLAAGADSNEAAAYYQLGEAKLVDQPKEAVTAFYWASRLRPNWAEALYAQRVATLMTMDPYEISSYMMRERKTVERSQIKALDSLLFRAYSINPYVYRKYDRQFLTKYIESAALAANPQADKVALSFAINEYVVSLGMSGQMAYADGRFPEALEYFATVLKEGKKHKKGADNLYEAHAERGRIFYLIGNTDSAMTEMGQAITQLRQRDEKQVVYVYESKALYEQSIAMIQEKDGHADAARESYGRALQEDLSYAPAHWRLAMLDLASNDTAGALSELDLAVQLRGDDPVLRLTYGVLLLRTDKQSEAAEQFGKAIAAEPYYALPYQMLGRLSDASDQRTEAVEQYRRFLQRCPRSDAQYAWTEQRIATLTTVATQAPKP